MLNQSTVYEDLLVDNKRFRVVKLNLEKNLPRSKLDKKKKKKPGDEQNEDASSGWINANPEEEEEKTDDRIYQDEIDCKVKLPSRYSKRPEDKPNEKVSVENLKLERKRTVDDIVDLDSQADKADDIVNLSSQADYTHFFALPLNIKEFQNQVKLLKTEVYRKFDNIFDEYYCEMDKLHLTLLMLRLETKEKVQKFQGLKNKIKEEIYKITKGKPINIEPNDLAVFNRGKGGKSGTIAVRAKENRGLALIRGIVDALVKLLLELEVIDVSDLSHVKYNSTTKKYELQEAHITLMRVSEKSKLKEAKYTLDDLAENFRRFGWGTVTCNSVVACTRGATGLDGFYDKILQVDIA